MLYKQGDTPSDTAEPDERSALVDEVDRQAEELEQLRRQAIHLTEEKARLESVVTQMTALLKARDALLDKLAQAVKDLRTLKFGKRSEKLAPGQLALAFEDLVLTVASLETQIDRIEEAAAKVSGGEDQLEEKRRRRRRDPDDVRASLPPHLPVIEEVIEPDSLECPCCKGAMHRIGETVARRLDVVPVQYLVRATIRPKYACNACETSIVQAPAPAHVVDIAAGKTSKPRVGSRGATTTGGEGVAARTLSTLHAIFEHAVRLEKIDRNPAKGVRRLASTPRERRLSRAELQRFGQALRKAEAAGEHPTGLAAIRFLLLTGFRRMEGLGLKRAWLDQELGAVRFPDTKSGAQTRIVGKVAMDILLAQPDIGSAYAFPADWGDGHFVGVVRVLDRVCGVENLDGVTPHTLRHTFASVAGNLGFSELTIAALLGHASRGVTQRYVHIDQALRLSADRVSEELMLLLGGGESSVGSSGAARPPPGPKPDRAAYDAVSSER